MKRSPHRWYKYMFENVHRKVKLIKYFFPQADPSSDPLIAITNIEVRILRDLHNCPDDHPSLPFPGEHPAWEGGGDHRLPGRRGQPIHHGAAQALPPRELVRLPQVRPLPLGLHLHWLLVQHDDPGHPVLGGPLHLAPPVQEQPGVSGRDCGLREHPDERDQGQGHVGHSHEQGFSKERRIGFLSQCPMFISKLTAPKASSMFRRQPVNTRFILSVHSCSSVGEAFILPIKKACGLRESFPTRKCQLSQTNPWIHLARTQLHFVYLSLLFGSASLLVLSVNLPDLYLVFHF